MTYTGTYAGTYTGSFERVGQSLPLPDLVTGIILLGTLFLADVISTEAILCLGGVELNPVMAGVAGSPILHIAVKMIILLLVMSTCRYAETKVQYTGGFALLVMLLWYGVVIGNNVAVLVGMS